MKVQHYKDAAMSLPNSSSIQANSEVVVATSPQEQQCKSKATSVNAHNFVRNRTLSFALR